MKQPISVLVAAMCCMLTIPAVKAAPDSTTIELAKSYFEKGGIAYSAGLFEEAIGWYSKAYETWPAPDFLYNIAQSYRLAGNCNQALFAYKLYLSLKEGDKNSPLTRDEQAAIEQLVKKLADCVANAGTPVAAQPSVPKLPSSTPQPAPQLPSVAPQPTSQPPNVAPQPTPPSTNVAPQSTNVAAQPTTPLQLSANLIPQSVEKSGILIVANANKSEINDLSVSTIKNLNARRVSLYAIGGIAKVDRGFEPAIAIGVDYPIQMKSFTFGLGAHISYSPLPYTDQIKFISTDSYLLELHPVVSATYQATARLSIRGQIGAGMVVLRDHEQYYPYISADRTITDLSLRSDIAVEYAITTKLIALIMPLDFSSTFDRSITQYDVLAGLGYRM